MAEKTNTNFEKPKSKTHPNGSELRSARKISGILGQSRLLLITIISLLAAACTSTPPPDDGDALQQAVRYQLAPDDDWNVIMERLNQRANSEDGQAILDMTEEDVSMNELGPSLVPALRPQDVPFLDRIEHGHDLEDTVGVVTMQTVRCTWEQIDRLLTSPLQDEIFDDTWDSHIREFKSDEGEYEDGREEQSFPSIPFNVPEDPSGEDVDEEGLSRTILVMEDEANPAANPWTDLGAYRARTTVRHGCYDGHHFATTRGFNFDEALDANGTGLFQSYWLSIYEDNGDGTTLRTSAVWTHKAIGWNSLSGDFASAETVRNGIAAAKDLERACLDEENR